MYKIGVLRNEAETKRFSHYLQHLGIEHSVRRFAEEHEIWVHNEEQVVEGRRQFTEFRQHPPQQRVQLSERPPQADSPSAPPRRRLRLAQPVTTSLIVASVIVYGLTLTPLGLRVYNELFIEPLYSRGGLQEVWSGEFWRLISPILLHFDPIHLLFNMLGLYILGSFIETKENSFRALLMVIAIAVGSNLAQYYLEGPRFGGMSGVVYGLFGYIWIRSKYDPWSGYYINPSVVNAMLFCLGIGFIGLLDSVFGPMANAAHLAGLLLGGLWAVGATHWRWP